MRRHTSPFALLILLAHVLLLSRTATAAEVPLRCPRFFSSNMVLQRAMPVPVWGWCAPKTKVTVNFGSQRKEVEAGENGAWRIKLDPMPALHEGRELVVMSGGQILSYTNVVVGEVWLASGQSNMDFGADWSKVEGGLNRPRVRMIKVPLTGALTPWHDIGTRWKDLDAEWKVMNEEWRYFSGVASLFAIHLEEELKIPVGVIVSSFGGSRIEPWIPQEGYDLFPEFKAMADGMRASQSLPADRRSGEQADLKAVKAWLAGADAEDPATRVLQPLPELACLANAHSATGGLYNAMIHPLQGFAIRGVIWYQGESNVGDESSSYERKMQALIQGWRKVWEQGDPATSSTGSGQAGAGQDFPFYFVQIAPCDRYTGAPLARFWEAQFNAMKSITNSGMVVTTDIASLRDIHGVRRDIVGRRLALWALAKQYGKDIEYSGPLYAGHKIKDGKMMISFDHAKGLAFKDNEVSDVYILGKGDTGFVLAKAAIEGDKLIVTHPEDKEPLHVRMGWNRNALCDLVNGAGLPASPFRTDKQ